MADASVNPTPIRLSKPNDLTRSRGLWQDALLRLTHHRLAMFGLLILLITLFLALFRTSSGHLCPRKNGFHRPFCAAIASAHLRNRRFWA